MTADFWIRSASSADAAAMAAIARPLVEAADTYAFDPLISDVDLVSYWNPSAPWRSFVAGQGDAVQGMFRLGPNQAGPGRHVANASFAVSATARGRGLGRWMANQALASAKDAGFKAMQFNFVVSSNQAALALWRSLGFDVIGTIPSGFKMPSGQFVDVLILHRPLD